MKKNLLVFGLVTLFGLGLASCNKCQTCSDCTDGVERTDESGNAVDELEICEDDADSKEEYDASIALLESFGGCKCK
ncbi:MAG: hypothetical protein HQ500_13060 [Flavobacteriales bacterium]|nr:hypothetical protein [Flavobacteriales bacterium]